MFLNLSWSLQEQLQLSLQLHILYSSWLFSYFRKFGLTFIGIAKVLDMLINGLVKECCGNFLLFLNINKNKKDWVFFALLCMINKFNMISYVFFKVSMID